ncbi:MAG: hypothetical protein ING72_11670 [Methylobacterium sp.]|jgi:hypothetical protein|nr:hypothetical protein [Methylobacterium sp.]MCA3596791.1 hypothetical protein [Methylobacterium sp.]MCA3600790.1 hypothetical protein [Methylobacterium sp.]MCA3604841.1 hypothetical protein [Methylobacterium sp.]MCA3606964.1 hypothetical protein [Methylobacterium sp.]
MLVSAAYSVSQFSFQRGSFGNVPATVTRDVSTGIGQLKAVGHLKDAPRLHREIHHALQSRFGLSRDEATILTMQIMTDALREANSMISVDFSIKTYRETQARTMPMPDERPAPDVIEDLNRKVLDWTA